MINHIISFVFTIVILSVILLETACSSDEILYDNERKNLQIEAEMTLFFNVDSLHVKSDTVDVSDSVIFIGSIYPLSQTRYQEYFWTLDGKIFSTDMNFRKPISTIGYHEICFVVVDYYGDTLRDTLNLWVSQKPKLDLKHFIPEMGTQGLNVSEGIRFAWNSNDSTSSLKYHFKIEEIYKLVYDYYEGQIRSYAIDYMDTIIDKPYFVYRKNEKYVRSLQNLHYYVWQVSAINEYGLESDTLVGNFYTSGISEEGAIKVNSFIYNQKYNFDGKLQIKVLDSAFQIVNQREVSVESLAVIIVPLDKGKYKVIASLADLEDYSKDTVDVQVFPKEVSETDTLYLIDSIPPSIEYLNLEDSVESIDTLDFRDTLKFYIEDRGGSFSTYVKLNGKILDKDYYENRYSTPYKGDTLTLFLPSFYKSWTYQLLTIQAVDWSSNKNSKTFIIQPSYVMPSFDDLKQETEGEAP